GMPVPSTSSLPSIGGSLPMPLDDQFPNLGGPGIGHLGEQASGGIDINSVNLAGSVGGEVELDGAIPTGGIGGSVDLDTSLPKPRARRETDSMRPTRTINIGRYLVGFVVFVAIGGALMGLSPRLGFYGKNFLADRANASKYESSLVALKKDEQEALDSDT